MELSQEQINKILPVVYPLYEEGPCSKRHRGRSCDFCGYKVPKGDTCLVIKYYDDDGYWPTFNVCNGCVDDNEGKVIDCDGATF